VRDLLNRRKQALHHFIDELDAISRSPAVAVFYSGNVEGRADAQLLTEIWTVAVSDATVLFTANL